MKAVLNFFKRLMRTGLVEQPQKPNGEAASLSTEDLEKLVAAGDVDAHFHLGMRYLQEGKLGSGLKSRGIRLIQEAVYRGHPKAREVALRLIQANTHMGQVEHFQQRLRLAMAGSAVDCILVAAAYASGTDVIEKSEAQSEIWWERAAELGHPDAVYRQALKCSTEGRNEVARAMFERLASKDDDRGHLHLSMIYSTMGDREKSEFHAQKVKEIEKAHPGRDAGLRYIEGEPYEPV